MSLASPTTPVDTHYQQCHGLVEQAASLLSSGGMLRQVGAGRQGHLAAMELAVHTKILFGHSETVRDYCSDIMHSRCLVARIVTIWVQG